MSKICRFRQIFDTPDAALELLSKWEEQDLIKKMSKIENSFKDSLLFKLDNYSIDLRNKLIINGININHKGSEDFFYKGGRRLWLKNGNQGKTFLYYSAECFTYSHLLELLCESLKKYYPDSYQDILNEEILLSDGKKKTALMIAAEKDHAKSVEFLIEEGADFQKRVDGVTPLECASEALLFPGAYEVIKEALQGNIKRNLTAAEKIGALSYCLKHMDLDTVRYLMTTKILPFPIRDIKDQNGNGILLILLLSTELNWDEKIELMMLLLNGTFQGDINQVNLYGTTPLMACLSNLNALKFLLNFDSLIPLDVNFQNREGNTALHYAVMDHNLQAVQALVAHPKIDLELENQQGLTPMELESDLEITKILFNSFLRKTMSIKS